MKCPICEKDFEQVHYLQRYCSPECNKEAQRRKARENNYYKKPAKPEPAVNSKSLTEWVREAKECNLDYGTYRALIATGKTFDELKAQNINRPAQVHNRSAIKFTGSPGRLI